jgi:2-polyprenyl-3-methyl-5-hydroxy-6-metoxy-1,4-benzoquinol methylase
MAGNLSGPKATVAGDLKSKYDNQYASGGNEWRNLSAQSKVRHITDICARNNVVPATLIDIGCGEGSILQQLDAVSFCPHMYGVDISRSAVAAVAARNLSSLIAAETFDGYETSFPDKFFDLALCSHVLEHVEFERLLLRELARISKHFVIEVPIDFRPQADSNFRHFLSYGHINMYSPTTLRFLLRTEGFHIIDDIVDVTDVESSCYNYFYNQKREPASKENIERKLEEWKSAVAGFRSSNRKAQEAMASNYTVLVSSETTGLQIFG